MGYTVHFTRIYKSNFNFLDLETSTTTRTSTGWNEYTKRTSTGTSTMQDCNTVCDIIKDLYKVYVNENVDPDMPDGNIVSLEDFKELAGEKFKCSICKSVMLTFRDKNHHLAIRCKVLSFPNDDKEIFFHHNQCATSEHEKNLRAKFMARQLDRCMTNVTAALSVSEKIAKSAPHLTIAAKYSYKAFETLFENMHDDTSHAMSFATATENAFKTALKKAKHASDVQAGAANAINEIMTYEASQTIIDAAALMRQITANVQIAYKEASNAGIYAFDAK